MKTAEKVVRRMIRELKKTGWRVCAVDDGEGNIPVITERDAMDLVFGVEYATVKFIKGGQIEAVLVIPCNEEDAISDFTLNTKEFEVAMDRLMDAVA
jgi:hypothetical protein